MIDRVHEQIGFYFGVPPGLQESGQAITRFAGGGARVRPDLPVGKLEAQATGNPRGNA
ncbi:MAG TPA: hypothetical protein VGB55_04365 [Tepidisphaeraceae bacterium]